ncbi:hypothetical protein [Microlunatus sp. Y2014]|uniref:hypothetical protein n=1 Tax=Microlunatus sp. Y2014 TaxID=3418488 RepID=UPI003DA76A82
MTYTDTMAKFAQLTEDEAVKILNLYDTGQLDRDRLITLLVGLLVVRADEAAQLADVALATQMSELRNQVVAPLGLTTDLDATAAQLEPEVEEAVDSDNRAYAVAVLGRALIMGTAQNAFHTGMQIHGVTTWKRVPNRGACEVCEDLASGLVSINDVMWTHKGCGCTQQPIK